MPPRVFRDTHKETGAQLVLYKHQKDAVIFMKKQLEKQSWAALLHDPGLGKTLTILTLWALMRKNYDHEFSLVVSCPAATIRAVWLQHITDWMNIPRSSVLVVDSMKVLEKPENKNMKKFKIVLITRDVLRIAFTKSWVWEPEFEIYEDRAGKPRWRGGWDLRKTRTPLFRRKWDLFVVDESHFMRNFKPKAVNIAAHEHFSRICRWGVMSTATPVCNRPDDVVGQLRSIGVNRERTGCSALCKISNWHGDNGFRSVNTTIINIFRLGSHRRTEDILQLPPIKVHTELFYTTFEGHHLEKYNEHLAEARDIHATMLKDGKTMADMVRMLAHLSAMKRMTVHTHLASKYATDWTDEDTATCLASPSPMMQNCLSAVQNAIKRGHRQITIFGLSSNTIMMIVLRYIKKNIPADSWIGLYSGGCNQAKRAELCKQFLSPTIDDQVKIMGIQMVAGGVGLNLVPGPDVAIFIEQDWSPATQKQALKRIHRIGQHKAVHVTHVISNGSPDHAIHHIHKDKILASNAVIDGEKLDGSLWRIQGRAVDLCKPAYSADMLQRILDKEKVMQTGTTNCRAF